MIKQKKIIIISTLSIMFIFATGYGAFQTIISINVRVNIVRDDRCVVGNVFDYEQKDEIQEFKVPCSGTYKLETWGASGGDVNDNYIGGYAKGYNVDVENEFYASGGTQNNPGIDGITFGSFGKGAIYGIETAGAGGGLYGGNGNKYCAGGGSSYIVNPSLTDKTMYCYDCEESLDLTKPEIFTVSTTRISSYRDTINCSNEYSENPVSKCAKKGDGFARITLISKK